MKKSREPESSLELLLDTMCNTFGGVMFIAIALIVVLSITVRSEAAIETTDDLTELRQKLRMLQEELKLSQKTVSSQSEYLKALEGDPRLKSYEQIFELEKTVQSQEQEKKRAEDAARAQTEQTAQAEQAKENERKKLQEEQAAQRAADDRLHQYEEELVRLQEQLRNVATGKISFKLLRKIENKTPFYLIVYNNRIWQIGPFLESTGSGYRIHSDVNAREEFRNGHRFVTCTIRPDAPGVPLLKNGVISPEARQLLQSLPADRFPDFSIHTNSLRDFCPFREFLKKEDRLHGLNINFMMNDEKFIFFFGGSGNYDGY